MTKTSVDASTGNLIVSGKRIFPIGLSDPPPVNGVAPDSREPAWAEIASAGVTFTRNYTVWTNAGAAEQLLSVEQQLDAASKHGLQLWLALAGIDHDLSRESLLTRIVDTVKGHPGLGAWKGADEPAHGRVPVPGLVAVRKRLRALDPDHPLVLIQAPRGPGTHCDGARHPVDGGRGRAVCRRLRHPRSRHLPRVEAAGRARRRAAGEHRHQRRGRHDLDHRARDPQEGDLDDAADLVERRLPAAPGCHADPAAGEVHGLRRDHRRSARPVLLRRAVQAGDERGRPAARLELDLLAERPAPAAPGAHERRPLTGPDRTHLEPCRQGERPRHPAQCARGRRLPLRDRGAEKSDLHRHGALHRAAGRHHARHRARTRPRQPGAAGEGRRRRVHRSEPVPGAQRARVSLPAARLRFTFIG